MRPVMRRSAVACVRMTYRCGRSEVDRQQPYSREVGLAAVSQAPAVEVSHGDTIVDRGARSAIGPTGWKVSTVSTPRAGR